MGKYTNITIALHDEELAKLNQVKKADKDVTLKSIFILGMDALLRKGKK
jgi:hypothetical protein